MKIRLPWIKSIHIHFAVSLLFNVPLQVCSDFLQERSTYSLTNSQFFLPCETILLERGRQMLEQVLLLQTFIKLKTQQAIRVAKFPDTDKFKRG